MLKAAGSSGGSSGGGSGGSGAGGSGAGGTGKSVGAGAAVRRCRLTSG